MSSEMQGRLIDAVKLLAGLGLAVAAYALGASDLAMFIAGGSLGHAVPTTRRSVAQ